jgi:hypothetical protein
MTDPTTPPPVALTEREKFEALWAERQGPDLGPFAFTRDASDPEEYADTAACFAWVGFRLAALSAPAVAPITDAMADAIHGMPYVRGCLLEYASRPVDETARAAVKAISALLAAQQPSPMLSTEPAPKEPQG